MLDELLMQHGDDYQDGGNDDKNIADVSDDS